MAAPRCEGLARGAWCYRRHLRPRAARRGDAPCAPRAAHHGAPQPSRGPKPTTTPGAPTVKCSEQAVPATQEQQRVGYRTRSRLLALRVLRAKSSQQAVPAAPKQQRAGHHTRRRFRALRCSPPAVPTFGHLGPPAPGSSQLPSGQLTRQPLLACETAEPSSLHPPGPHGNVQPPPHSKPHCTPPPLLAQPPPPRAPPPRLLVGAPGGRHDALGLHRCKECTGPLPSQHTAHQCASPARLK